ncbi:MAG: hypothetical protein J0H74_06880 [Chitinophagaceae bacterium]|nr:hypothetical protein [Chitinophagaceae bacterium]
MDKRTYVFRWIVWFPASLLTVFLSVYVVGIPFGVLFNTEVGMLLGFMAGSFLAMWVSIKIVPDRKKTVAIINISLLAAYLIYEIIMRITGVHELPLIMAEGGFLSGFVGLCMFYPK